MADVKKYSVGTVFKSSRFDEAWVISDIVVTGNKNKTVRGKSIPASSYSYEISHIPEVIQHVLPSGVEWIHKFEPFNSHDEIIDREISLGNWIMSE